MTRWKSRMGKQFDEDVDFFFDTGICLACANRPKLTLPVGVPAYCSLCNKRLVSYDESTESQD